MSIISILRNPDKITSSAPHIYELPVKNVVTRRVGDFYSEHPFPNYRQDDTRESIISRVESSPFLRSLRQEIGFGKRFIEVGCGTGQLSVAMSYGTNSHIVALDPTIESLEMGYAFSRRGGIDNIDFVRADIFDNPFLDHSFDIVWCSGVLHHTEDPHLAFKIISKWVKPGGLVIVGLYNTFGRLATDFRRYVFKALGSRGIGRSFLRYTDPVLRGTVDTPKFEAWLRDQYLHPVESKYTIDDILRWFSSAGITFAGSIPSCVFGDKNYKISELSSNTATLASRLASQIDMLFDAAGGEGGLFIMTGRKEA